MFTRSASGPYYVPDESSKLRTSYWVSFCSAVYAFLPHVISSHQLFPFAIEFRQLQKECTRHVKRKGKLFKVDISWATMFNVQKFCVVVFMDLKETIIFLHNMNWLFFVSEWKHTYYQEKHRSFTNR